MWIWLLNVAGVQIKVDLIDVVNPGNGVFVDPVNFVSCAHINKERHIGRVRVIEDKLSG